MQKRPTTQPRDYITAFSKNFPNVKVHDLPHRSSLLSFPPSLQDSDRQHLHSQTATPGVHMQGGTCILVGDTPSRVTEAANFAKKHLGCKIMQSTPYYRTDGHLQVSHPCAHALP